MAGGDPPDSFQIHGGAELLDNWVKGNDLTQPLTELYEAEGLNDKFPPGIVELVSLGRRPVFGARWASTATACSGPTRRSSRSTA